MKKFTTEEEARKFYLSEEFDHYVEDLESQIKELKEKAKTETPILKSMGGAYDGDTPSGISAEHLDNEVSGLREVKRYFSGKQYIGYIPKLNDSYTRIYLDIDKTQLSPNHPGFLEFVGPKLHQYPHTTKDDWYEEWYKYQMLGVSTRDHTAISRLFKLHYSPVVKNLVPDANSLINFGGAKKKEDDNG